MQSQALRKNALWAKSYHQSRCLTLLSSPLTYENQQDDDGADDGGNRISGQGVSVDDWLSRTSKAQTNFTIIPHITNHNNNSIGLIEIEKGALPLKHYILSLSSHTEYEKSDDYYVMIDVPPFSSELVEQIRLFMSNQDAGFKKEEKKKKTAISTKGQGKPRRHKLRAIIVTNKKSVHYSEAPGTVYVMRKSDMVLWKEAFPGVEIIMHRNDVEQDLRGLVTQVLDGYGPWALNESTGHFEETGRKMKVLNWDREKIMRLYNDDNNGVNATEIALREAGVDPNEIIDVRANEAKKRILAVFTPGHTMGSVCYVMPFLHLCFSGNTIPENTDRFRFDGLGPISTNSAGLSRQVESAHKLVESYIDRFHTILPAQGNAIILHECDEQQRRSFLDRLINHFDKVAKAYTNLGIL